MTCLFVACLLAEHLVKDWWCASLHDACIAVGPEVNPHMVSLLYPVERNLKAVGTALAKPVS